MDLDFYIITSNGMFEGGAGPTPFSALTTYVTTSPDTKDVSEKEDIEDPGIAINGIHTPSFNFLKIW